MQPGLTYLRIPLWITNVDHLTGCSGARLHWRDPAPDGPVNNFVENGRQPLLRRGPSGLRSAAGVHQLFRLLLDADVAAETCRSEAVEVLWTTASRTASYAGDFQVPAKRQQIAGRPASYEYALTWTLARPYEWKVVQIRVHNLYLPTRH